MGVSEAARSGDRLATLEALRDALAGEIDSGAPNTPVAALARQLTLVLAEIAELAPPKKNGTPLDQLAQRRRARGAETKGSDSAEGSAGSS